MNILIVGCGRVGSSMVRLLEEMEHQVSVLDIDPKAFIIVCSAHEVLGSGFHFYQKNDL